jgi:hypothetical protein
LVEWISLVAGASTHIPDVAVEELFLQEQSAAGGPEVERKTIVSGPSFAFGLAKEARARSAFLQEHFVPKDYGMEELFLQEHCAKL